MFAVDVEVGEGDGGVVGDFFFERDAGLLDAGSDEIRCEGGDVAGDALGESRGQHAVGGIERAAYQRIGVRGEYLAVEVMIVVKEYAGVGDAVFGGDGGVIDLGDADVEESVSGADDQRTGVADGVGESDAGGEVVGVVGNFSGGRK